MSQAAKQLITIILVVLLCAAVGVSVIASLNNKKLSGENAALTQKNDEYRTLETKQAVEIAGWKEKFDKLEKEKNELLTKINSAGGNIDEISAKVKDLTRERDELKNRFEVVQKERDDLTVKLSEKMRATVVESTNLPADGNGKDGMAPKPGDQEDAKVGSESDEDYWARILKAKVSLQMDLDKIKEDLSKSALEISELKKQNSDLQLEISKLNSDKEEIARQIKYGNDLAKNLSLELARSQSEKQFMSDRMNKISDENSSLHEQLKNLTSTKVALEKSIVKLQKDKKQIEGKLFETEGVIQNRVEQIYQLKDSLQKDFKPAVKDSKTAAVELSPIVINPDDKDVTQVKSLPIGVSGSVVSINDENNFVIVNFGEDAGIKVGEKLNVYRGPEYIAALEVIQVRKDILAADIKSKTKPIEVGDSVK